MMQEQDKECLLLIQNSDLSEYSLVNVRGMDAAEVVEALSAMNDDDRVSVAAYLESRGAWTTEIANEKTKEFSEYHLDVRYNADTNEIINVKAEMELNERVKKPIGADDVILIAMIALTLLLSAKMKSPYLVLTVIVPILFVPMFFTPNGATGAYNLTLFLLPYNATIPRAANYITYQFGGLVMDAFTARAVLYALLSVSDCRIFWNRARKITPKQWKSEIQSLQSEYDSISREKLKTAIELAYVEVISYNKKNLARELQNESRQRNRQQGKTKRREEEI